MDFRIVNMCNNDCLYCLEQEYRQKEKYIDKNIIFSIIDNIKKDEIINFYGWNSLLHPDFIDIIKYCKNNWFISIGILTNTYSLNKSYLDNLINNWLNTISFYFNSFDEKVHNNIVKSGISLNELIQNIKIINKAWIYNKTIVHINKLNLKTLYRDLIILNKQYNVQNIEFINYFPFDRPYEKFRNLLEYDYNENRKYINLLFKVILKLKINAKFIKFSKDFFWINSIFYDFNRWILSQIRDEDRDRLSSKNPFCLLENRCKYCFIKDNCVLLWENII